MMFYIDKYDMHKIWILNGIKNIPNNITISTKKSIYDIYEIGTADLSSYLIQLFNSNCIKFTFDEINTPITIQCRQEQDFKKFRERLFPNLDFQYPECNARVYDVIINKYFKVQDKVICIHTKNRNNKIDTYYITALYRQKNILYKLGDNDYYWLFLPDKSGAYIIPELILYNHNLISNSHTDVKGNILYLHPYPKDNITYKTLWLNKYLYFFDKQKDIAKIESLFINNNTVKNISYDDNCELLNFKYTYINVIKVVNNIFQKIRKYK